MNYRTAITNEEINEVLSIVANSNITKLAEEMADIYGLKYSTMVARIYSIRDWRRQKPQNFRPIYHYLTTGEKLEFDKPVVKKPLSTVKPKQELTIVNIDKDSWEYKLSEKFYKSLEAEWNVTVITQIKKQWLEKVISDWVEIINKLQRIDNLSKDAIIWIITFGRTDEFWKEQFFTLAKLRKLNKDKIHYSTVFLQKCQNIVTKPKVSWIAEM